MLQNFGSKNEVQNVHKCFGKHICNLVGRESHWVVYLKQDSPVCGLEHYQILFVFVVSSWGIIYYWNLVADSVVCRIHTH
jgi:hypothetical protein